ncbi:MAG: YicC/YloC family endoribonuclease [Desulfomonilia bacterium]|nr:YicC/YloC family endoribonuclease [Desulfomonilia bacterium]
MTGFGQANDHGYHVEIKGVNHRYRDIRVRLPKDLSSLEIPARDLISKAVSRGKVEVSVNRDARQTAQEKMDINWELARSYFQDLSRLAEDFGGEVCFRDLAVIPGVFSESQRTVEEQWPLLEQTLSQALDAFSRSKEAEGASLYTDIASRVDILVRLKEEMEREAHTMVSLYRDRLKERLDQLLGQNTVILDDIRLEQEIALMADRSDITEELVRLEGHLTSLRTTLDSSESIGRRLDFILQEINREINTIGSKGQVMVLSHAVIEAKTEIEKIREQVQNIE